MSDVLAQLQACADPARAVGMARYHKTPLPVLGASNPQINDIVAAWRAEHPMADWPDQARALWTSGVFEARIAAGKLLIKARIPDPRLEAEIWDLIASWVPDFDGWAIADHVANAGERRIMADLSRLDRVEHWTRSDHLWTRRAALVFTLPLAKLPHPNAGQAAARARVLGWAAGYAPDPEWFIQKAIGWWLRTLSQHDPDAVRAFIAAHGDTMKPFARREALRKLG